MSENKPRPSSLVTEKDFVRWRKGFWAMNPKQAQIVTEMLDKAKERIKELEAKAS